jgi:acyl-CoA hydrolase
MNTTMMVTLLGAAASDALESGQVVSGVGGQYNFVAMAHALPDARSILMLRATHDTRRRPAQQHRLELRPRDHPAPPARHRHHRVRRGRPARPADSEVVKRLIAIADSRFQDELVREAKATASWKADWTLPERYRHNLPERWTTNCTRGARPACCRTSRSAPT